METGLALLLLAGMVFCVYSIIRAKLKGNRR